MDLKEKAGPVAAGFVLLCVGAALGRVVVPSTIDDARMRAIAAAVVVPAGEPLAQVTSGDPMEWKALREMDKEWPGHIDWVIRYSDEARTLFAANGQQKCPGGEILRGVSRCVFNAPARPYTIRKDPSLPPAAAVGRDRR